MLSVRCFVLCFGLFHLAAFVVLCGGFLELGCMRMSDLCRCAMYFLYKMDLSL